MSRGRSQPKHVRLARRAIDAAAFIAGFGVSALLLSNPSLAMVALWLALFVAVTAFAIIQREMPR